MLRERLVKVDLIGDKLSKLAEKFASEGKLAIWGAGRGGEKALEFLKLYSWTGDVFFIDSDERKWGMLYQDKYKIISPEEFFGDKGNEDVNIMITCADSGGC